MKKLLCLLGIFLLSGIGSLGFGADSFNKVISDSDIPKDNISVSVKNAQTGSVLYELNAGKLVSPASTQKLVTLAAAADTLGSDYQFQTSIYKSTNNDLYIKLGADPYLSSNDLKTLLTAAKEKRVIAPKNIYIDASILDNVDWGDGWQWDDDLNILMPRFGAYNLDGNLLGLLVAPTVNGAPAEINTKVFYPVTFMNLVVTGSENNIKFERNNAIAPDMISVKGTVSKSQGFALPVNNLKRYFRLRLEDALRDVNIEYYGNITEKKLPSNNVYLISSVKHPLLIAQKDILIRSSNLAAETVFKTAGGKYVNGTGSVDAALKMFDAYCKKIGINHENIKIVDGSGVSKNNLMSADFMTDFLVAQAKLPGFPIMKKFMATSGEGTLTDRMLYFKDNLRAKTGTLSDISAIAGYITSRNGTLYAFDIMINDAKSRPIDKKVLEEYIIRTIYLTD